MHKILYDLTKHLNREIIYLNIWYSYCFKIWPMARQQCFSDVFQILQRLMNSKHRLDFIIKHDVRYRLALFSFQKDALWCLNPCVVVENQQYSKEYSNMKMLRNCTISSYMCHIICHSCHLHYYIFICNNITSLYEAWVRLHNCGKCKSNAMFCIERDIETAEWLNFITPLP